MNNRYLWFFQRGQKLLSEGRSSDARVAFLNAAKCLYEMAKTAPDVSSSREWIGRAERLLAIAEKLEEESPASGTGTLKKARAKAGEDHSGFSPQSSKSSSLPSSSEEEGENGESRWELSEIPDITFDDIAGLEPVKRLMRERVLYPLHHPEIAAAYHRSVGTGVVMFGPPGTGKTMMAKAIAGELRIPFFSVQSSSILSKWVGDSEQNIRQLFEEARDTAPSVLFFDECEALLGKRGEDSSPAMSRIIPEFLAQLDGVSKDSKGLLLIGATNRPWDLDPAMTRTGRFGEKIYIPLPDAAAREFLLRKKLQDLPGAADLDLALIVEKTEGFSGADINGLIYRIIDPVFARAVECGTAQPVTQSDVEAAFELSHPSVTKEELARYEEYIKEISK